MAGARPARSATDWAQARAFLAEEPASLLALDVHMGSQVSGDAMNPQLERIPGCGGARVLPYSALKLRDLKAIGRCSGADAVISKGDDDAFLATCSRLVPPR